MKLYLVKIPDNNSCLYPNEIFTIGKCYECETYPILKPDLIVYIVKCDDGNSRRVDGDCLITQEEWRESKLNELGI
jgi:hypothetical protein